MRRAQRLRLVRLAMAALAGVCLTAAAGRVGSAFASPTVTDLTFTLSIVGTSDLHGYYMTRGGRGGIGLFAGFVNNLRAVRARDGGAVLLLDAGDTFQGGVESNLSEGAVVVDAYNALGYAALAVGNHEFDFGAADLPGARQDARADMRGALKARAAQARFPFLAANLLDEAAGARVDWPNVHASTIVEVEGIRVGIIGVMTAGALRATLPLNVRGLKMAPLTGTVSAEAARLRAGGARVVIVAAHAGGGCERFDDADNLSSCDPNAEIFDVARDVPRGLIDAIVAGHTHAGLAHRVNGIPIVQSYWGGRAFGRVDLTVERASGHVVGSQPFAPREICEFQDPITLSCDAPAGGSPWPRTQYEGRTVVEDARIIRAMAPALTRVRQLQDTPLGVVLDATLARTGDPESPLGNMFADALREEGNADVALNNNSLGGLRADLPHGPLTFGQLYDTFPFDNRLVRVNLTAATLEQGIASALRRGRRGAFGISGARVRVGCGPAGVEVQLFRATGQPIGPAEPLVVVGMDSLLGGQLFAPVITPGSLQVPPDAPVVREVVEDWLRDRGGHLRAGHYLGAGDRRLEFDGAAPCLAQ
ncbi:MAG TPA: bifunctional UDP-sugar hydrolase/5'-nucleotidase [Vicinamibacterales bacterium]|nr:bifunctional UDP-sugar hydrolase/5'-nucleotidase [Vicinamibacterales bacterium]